MTSGQRSIAHWADVLALRPEVRATDGSVGELQMSLHKAVYQTVDVPYRKVDYYVDITQPTPNLIGFFSQVARRLGASGDSPALYHLDQGMGGGKSHALVGLYHMARNAKEFFATGLGQQVRTEAEYTGVEIDLGEPQVITLNADYFSPGMPSETFGPATTLFQRFVYALVEGDLDRYHHFVGMGPNKDTLQQALLSAGRPLLILLDELMDYVLDLSDAAHIATMPGEKAFLNALMDACDDVPRVALVIVMIRSEYDERGYPFQAEDFRDYVAKRLVRNGKTVAVTEAQDFASIIRRRLFDQVASSARPAELVGSELVASIDAAWQESVFDKLGPNRGKVGLPGRVESNYPFHPELMRLVRDEWSQVQGFQRVRSTVAIFARTTLHWYDEHKAGRWAPELMGVGDIPLTVALEELLSSGLLLGNDRAIQGRRAVAGTDVTSTDGTGGRAVGVDATLSRNGVRLGQPAAAVRMASAMFCYSLVGRAQARRGATKAELLSSIFEPGLARTPTSFTAAEEVFNALTGDEGLGALDVITPRNAPTRYYLSIKQTLRMYFTAAMALVKPEQRADLVWEVAQGLASKGTFDELIPVHGPEGRNGSPDALFGGIDSSNSNRLIVLDPRRWTLLNGKDTASRAEIVSLLGLGPTPLHVDNAASCIVACVNTQRRDVAIRRAGEVLAWRYVIHQIDDAEDELIEARAKLAEVDGKLKNDVLTAYQHYSYLLRTGNELTVEFRRFDQDGRSSLRGDHVWTQLVADGRATIRSGLAANYVATLLDDFDRTLTPKEVVQAFYKNPAFPLASAPEEIRRVLFDLIADEWELVDSDGTRLSVTSPGQIQINSLSTVLRRRVQQSEVLTSSGESTNLHTPSPTESSTPTSNDNQRPQQDELDLPDKSKPMVSTSTANTSTDARKYKRYNITLANRSVTSIEGRDQVWQLLRELAKVVDPAYSEDNDHQLVSLDFTLTTLEGDQGSIELKAQQVNARLRVEDDEF
ncbi:DUF499 domain-containing protein [Arthrobacter sp. LjRoot78]|uniref:DUF499 domain-containing protein n=1 Tax=Arthrobacter sp. LjRoot78 TaxID=3342338 RepID=UPI003ECC86B1